MTFFLQKMKKGVLLLLVHGGAITGDNCGSPDQMRGVCSSDQSTLPTVIWALWHPTKLFFAKSKYGSRYTAPVPRARSHIVKK